MTASHDCPVSSPVLSLYQAALPSTRTGALFNAFSYPTKISAEAAALFLAAHTSPGDTVLDVFSGSGSTGIAAVLAERPTPKMISTAADLGLTPKWGPRNAVLYDISEIGTLAARVMTSPPEPSAFAAAADALLNEALARVGALYNATDPDGNAGTIRHVIWTEHLRCRGCASTIAYAEARVRYSPLRFVDEYSCPGCDESIRVDDAERVSEERWDSALGRYVSGRLRTPWRVYGVTGAKKWSRPATEADAAVAAEADVLPLPAGSPIAELHWGDLYRAGYHQGMTHLHHLYSRRNFLVLAECWRLAAAAPDSVREALQAWILSYNSSHSTLMTRVVLKKASTDFVLTGSQSGILYVSALPVEKNILTGLRRKLKTFSEAFAIVHGSASQVRVVTCSSTELDLADESIDYVFTDPPFGDFIPYAEINQVNELWLEAQTDDTHEAVISSAQGKTVSSYEELLTAVFSETARVLKPDALGTVVFHSAKAAVWQSLASSLHRAGLEVLASSVLDKKQGSFKQVSAHDSVSGDPLLLIGKSVRARSADSVGTLEEELVGQVLRGHAGKKRERLYADFVGLSLAGGVPVTLDARDFYHRVEQMQEA